MPYSTPILLLIFNRPDKTRLMFDSIRQFKPGVLYIAADGPRKDKEGDVLLCKKTRDIVSEIDWPCTVKKLFRDENSGCGLGPANAISWFFDHVDEGIILEDDCIPDPSFFYYCEELLDKYRDNDQIMHIGGCNFQKNNVTRASYYFSNYVHVWGWATWKRAWSAFQFHVTIDDSFDSVLHKRFSNKSEIDFWKNYMKNTFEFSTDVWDVQWVYAIFLHNGISINPAVNLICNIGYGSDATHTHKYDPIWSEMQTQNLNNIVHPKKITINKPADDYTYKTLYHSGQTRFNKIKFKIGKNIPVIKSLYHTFLGKKNK